MALSICHPLVREHCPSRTTCNGHNRLYEYFSGRAPLFPESFDAMLPLVRAVYHGCRAGRHQEALEEVYKKRIVRHDRGEYFLTRKLGAFGTNLAILANFFIRHGMWSALTFLPWIDRGFCPKLGLHPPNSGSTNRGPVAPAKESLNTLVSLQQWKRAATTAGTLSELHLRTG